MSSVETPLVHIYPSAPVVTRDTAAALKALEDKGIDVKMEIKQQPNAAVERGVIGPSTVVEISVSSPSGSAADAEAALKDVRAMVTCAPLSKDGKTPTKVPQVMGNLASEPRIVTDQHGQLKAFATFNDITYDTAGEYRFLVSFVATREGNRDLEYYPVISQATSDVFTVYRKEDYPFDKDHKFANGELGAHLAKQGLRV